MKSLLATACANQPERPESDDWRPIRTAPRHYPVLLLTRDLSGQFETPFVGRWSPGDSCWVNTSIGAVSPVYPEFWTEFPATKPEVAS